MSMNPIVEKNLEKMVGDGPTDMPPFLMRQSIGGIHWRDYSCRLAYFFVDQDMGEIIAFGNAQYLPEEVTQRYAEEMFMLAYDVGKTWKNRIVDYHPSPEFSPLAKSNLEASVEAYNLREGFPLEDVQ